MDYMYRMYPNEQKPQRLNDEERRQWVLNDEGLYNWYKSERTGLQTFIKDNRTELDRCINKALGRG